MKRYILIFAAILLFAASCKNSKQADGEYSLHILTTNDIHGTWFDIPYTQAETNYTPKNSILAINTIVQKFRDSLGEQNIVLLDAGDCLQGDNAPYYFNYVDTTSTHLYARIVNYMKYDAVAVGNHDIETSHSVYDRVARQMKELGVPFLAGNAIRYDNGKPYFQKSVLLKRATPKSGNGGELKIAVLGYTNPNMKAWLAEDIWSGMHFESLIPLVQKDVDEIVAKEKPNVVIVVAHSGVGNGDGSIYESQGLDLFNSLKGVDLLVCSHDHKAFIAQNDTMLIVNSGSHSRNVTHSTIDLVIKDGQIVHKKLSAELVPVNANDADSSMRNFFKEDYEKIKQFTLQPVGQLNCQLSTRASFSGMSNYMNLIHTLGLSQGADISIAAPLTYDKTIEKGTILYNDLFTIYPYENQMYIIRMNGNEIKEYLEYSYDGWINSVPSSILSSYNPDLHLLKIQPRDDYRYAQKGWSFVNRSYNFDSAGGIDYTVDITKPFGERVAISSMADGSEFDLSKEYRVVMTSYRASGGGDILKNGAGIDPDNIDVRILERKSEYRYILYKYLQEKGAIDSVEISNQSTIGRWMFVPKQLSDKYMQRDLSLLFGKE